MRSTASWPTTRPTCPRTAHRLLLELPLVVALPELRRRPWFVRVDGDRFETFHVAGDVQALVDVLRRQAELIQRHALQWSQVGDSGAIDAQRPQRHGLELRQAHIADP